MLYGNYIETIGKIMMIILKVIAVVQHTLYSQTV
jgi:hypothetical protein